MFNWILAWSFIFLSSSSALSSATLLISGHVNAHMKLDESRGQEGGLSLETSSPTIQPYLVQFHTWGRGPASFSRNQNSVIIMTEPEKKLTLIPFPKNIGSNEILVISFISL